MLHCFTASHHTTGFETLERLERSADALADSLAADETLRGSVVLATCNRFEVYVDETAGPRAVAGAATRLPAAVAAAAGLSVEAVRAGGDLLREADVAEHAIAVASGLESVVVGEGEIAGQVRRALEAARARGTASRELERLFTKASRTSRGVKNRTGLSSAGRSVVRLALDLAESRVTDWAGASVLLVGTGRYAGATLAALRDRGARRVRVYSRSGRAAAFAEGHGVEAVAEDRLIGALAASDLVVACTVAPTVVIDASTVAKARRIPGALPRRLVVDLGLPRNVDPGVASAPDTELLDLETIGAHAPLPELHAARDARILVDAAVAEYRAARAEDDATPALVALRRHVFDVLDGEVERARRRGDDGRTEAALRHLAGVLLHTPSMRARMLARRGRVDEFESGVAALFGVEAERRCPVSRVDARPAPLHDAADAAEADAADTR